MPSTVVIGAQWGDEGKGKVVDYYAGQADLVVRYQGGNNAGHTVIVDDVVYAFHLFPVGILQGKDCVIGNGMVVDLESLLEEWKDLESKGVVIDNKLSISDHCHLVLPYHRLLDKADEKFLGQRKIGTTGRGIGPAYADKASRRGIRMGELATPELFREHLEANVAEKNQILTKIYDADPVDAKAIYDDTMERFHKIAHLVGDTSALVNRALDEKKQVLFEGAHGTLLDIDFGTYPYVTSSSPISGAVCCGAGVGPKRINLVTGVVKAYTTRVGEGPFPTEMEEECAAKFRPQGREFGTTTGRPRRIGWMDLVMVKKAVRLSGIEEIAVTHLDVLDQFDSIPVCIGYERNGKRVEDFPNLLCDLADCRPIYEELPGWKSDTTGARTWEDLPAHAQKYIEFLEKALRVKTSMILVGPSREQTIVR